jgi:serine protease Do
MKRLLAVIFCSLITAFFVHQAFAQHTVTRATLTGSGGYLGVGVAEVDDERAKALKLKEDHGVVVMNVDPDTPAAKAGMKESDVILQFNGQRVEGVDQFMRMVRETPPNRKVTLQISRNGALQTVTVSMGARSPQMFIDKFDQFKMPDMSNMPDLSNLPKVPPVPPIPNFKMPEIPRPSVGWAARSVGIEVVSLNSQLAEYFGVKQGALVQWVSKSSPAEKAGIKAGDVVTKVNGNTVTSPHEIARLVRGDREGNPVPFSVVRNHKDLTVTVKPSEGWQSFDEDERER